jgi:hypothetical protein
MFARIMGIVSPSIFLASSILWGLSARHPVAVVLSVALGASAAFMSFRAWRKATGGIADRLAGVEWQEVVGAVRVAWKRYWKNAAFIAALYGLNLALSLVFKGAYRFRAWDVFMLWFIVDAMLLSSWVELLRKRVGDLSGEGDAS